MGTCPRPDCDNGCAGCELGNPHKDCHGCGVELCDCPEPDHCDWFWRSGATVKRASEVDGSLCWNCAYTVEDDDEVPADKEASCSG